MGHGQPANEEADDGNQAGPLHGAESADGMTARASIGPTRAESHQHAPHEQHRDRHGMGPSFGTEQGRGSERGSGIGDAHGLQALHGGGIQGHSVVAEQEIAGHGSAGDGAGHEHQIPRPGKPINLEVLRETVRPGRSTERLEVGTEAKALPDQQEVGHGDYDEGPYHIPRPR